MHHLLLAPAILVGLSGLSSTFALPTQDHNKPIAPRSEPATSTSDVSTIADVGETLALAGAPKLTPDNTCGNTGDENSGGYTCDPKRQGGGPCCSGYVSLAILCFDALLILV
jgi:hypothetical protein